MQGWELGAPGTISYWPVCRDARRWAAAAAGGRHRRGGQREREAQAGRLCAGPGNQNAAQRGAERLRRGPSLQSPGFSGSRTTPGGAHSATPRAVLPLLNTTRLRGLSRFPLSKKAQFRGRNPRSFLGNGVSVKRILGVVVPTVRLAHAHFRFTSRFLLLGSTGKETCASMHVRPPTVCPRAPCPVGREPGVAGDRRTCVPVGHSRQS